MHKSLKSPFVWETTKWHVLQCFVITAVKSTGNIFTSLFVLCREIDVFWSLHVFLQNALSAQGHCTVVCVCALKVHWKYKKVQMMHGRPGQRHKDMIHRQRQQCGALTSRSGTIWRANCATENSSPLTTFTGKGITIYCHPCFIGPHYLQAFYMQLSLPLSLFGVISFVNFMELKLRSCGWDRNRATEQKSKKRVKVLGFSNSCPTPQELATQAWKIKCLSH